MTAFLILLLFSPALVLGLQAFLVRLCRAAGSSPPPQALAVWALALGAPLSAALSWPVYISRLQDPGELAAALSYAALVYAGLGYSYFHLFNMSQTSRRLRILYELSLAAGPLPGAALQRRYSPEDQLRRRLDRLHALGQIRRDGKRYRLQGFSLSLAARGLSLWARLLGLKL